jgi:branched-chain amino acid aminotransferase
MPAIHPKAYFGDRIVPTGEASLSVASSAVLYGLSVYTVLPAVKTDKGMALFRLEDHFARLVNSAKIIGIDTFEKQWDFARFRAAVKEVVKENGLQATAFIRATVHVADILPGTRSRGLQTVLSIFAYEAAPIMPQGGARLKTSHWRRVPDVSIPSRAKVNGAYVNSVLGKQDALDSGYDDCVFLDAQGHVCELSAANIFIVRNGRLVTPGTSSDILEGINRKTVLEIAAELGIPTEERSIDLTELCVADEAFACGTSSFVAPIVEVDKRAIGSGKPGPIAAHLKERFEALMTGRGPRPYEHLTII